MPSAFWRTRLGRVGIAVTPALVVASGVGLSSCRDATEIVVSVTTDIPCANLKSTLISVGVVSDVDTKPPASTSTQCVDGHIGTLVVVPSGSEDDEVALRVVTGIGKTPDECAASNFTGGCVVARRALRFQAHSTLRVPVAMRASCIDVPCGASGSGAFETCVKGACVSARIASAACSGDGCDESALGPGTGNDGGAPGDTGAPGDGGTPNDGGSNDGGSNDGNLGDANVPPSTGGGTWIPMDVITSNARSEHHAVWTGTEMLVFGGDIGPGGYARNGAHFDPAQNKWTHVIPDYPMPGNHHRATVVWADNVKRALYWGGADGSITYADGAQYDPAILDWIPMAAAPAGFKGRDGHTAVWTGTEMIVWGGSEQTASTLTRLSDGAAYNPVTNTWRMLPPSPLSARERAAAVWDGMVARYFGGLSDNGFEADYASYVPSAVDAGAAWSPLATAPLTARPNANAFAVPRASGSPLSIFFGGGDYNNDFAPGNGFILDPDNAGTPTRNLSLPPTGVLPLATRLGGFVWFGKGRLWTFAGDAYDGLTQTWNYRGDGASWDLATSQWKSMPAPPGNGPVAARINGTVVWTGERAILYGGAALDPGDSGFDHPLGDGWMFIPD